MKLCEALLAFMFLELRPKLEMLINNFQSLLIVLGQLYLFPELAGQMSPFDSFHVQIAVTFVFENSCIARIG